MNWKITWPQGTAHMQGISRYVGGLHLGVSHNRCLIQWSMPFIEKTVFESHEVLSLVAMSSKMHL
ncbi:hypothetical protein BDA96_05G003900 [Sorghum bicolor]|uniref:Uncharacterized protein n=1 Tax=Sorghum bicolor TaxID=4558 RepID=A0A921QTZ4_SORBI|nr:hypothetical protein BDA96_05G003900 [Sorghum bicolor]